MSDINYQLSCARRDELLRVAAERRRAGEAKAMTSRAPERTRASRIRRVSRLAVPRWAH